MPLIAPEEPHPTLLTHCSSPLSRWVQLCKSMVICSTVIFALGRGLQCFEGLQGPASHVVQAHVLNLKPTVSAGCNNALHGHLHERAGVRRGPRTCISRICLCLPVWPWPNLPWSTRAGQGSSKLQGHALLPHSKVSLPSLLWTQGMIFLQIPVINSPTVVVML